MITEKTPLISKKYEGRITQTLLLTALSSAIGSGFIFGYDISVLNTPEDILKLWINESYVHLFNKEMSVSWNNWIFTITSSILLIGGAVGSLFSGPLADKYGRKLSLLLNNVLLLMALLFLGLSKKSQNYRMLIVGRLIMGFHNGIATGLLPMYLTEISPQNLRGGFGGIMHLSVVTGVLVAQILGLDSILGTKTLWPALLCMPALFGLIQLSSLPFCPESPKHLLINMGNSQQATKALRRLRGTEDVKEEMAHLIDVAENLNGMEEVRFLDLLIRKQYRWPILIAIVMMLSRHFGGIFAVIFYSTATFVNAGLTEMQAQYGTLGVGAIQVVVTMCAIFVMDIGGRRSLQILGLVLQLVMCIGVYVFLTLERATNAYWTSILGIVFTMLFVGAYCIGPGPIPWILSNELFQINARGRANSVAVMCNWLASFLVALIYPILSDIIGQHSFLIFVFLLILLTLFTMKFVPETKGIPIVEIVEKFQYPHWKKWPIFR